MKLRSLLSLSLLSIGCSFPLRALEFRLVSWEGKISNLKYSNGSTQVPVEADESALSPVYHLKNSGPLVLYKEVQTEGKIVREPVATLPIPENFKKAIILLAYADATRKTYTGSWINDAPDIRPPQTVTYRNFSIRPVAIKLGTEEHIIPPLGGHTQTTDAAVQRVVFKLAAHTSSKWEVVANTIQPVRPGLRTLVLLREGRPDNMGHRELIDMLKFDDYPPPPEPPTVASR